VRPRNGICRVERGFRAAEAAPPSCAVTGALSMMCLRVSNML
jgi:hypothetical protein